MKTFRPSREQLLAAKDRTLPDIIAPGLKVVFCGINPGLYSAAVGHHFARPGNRFWKILFAAGFTPRLLSPFEDHELIRFGCGITNLVDRATAAADELSAAEIARGGARLEKKLRRFGPCACAVLGMGAYRTAFGKSRASVGALKETIGGVRLWVLPNPSGLNAGYQLDDLVRLFRKMKKSVESGT